MVVRKWLVAGIFGIALIGLGSYVFNNPIGLIKNILFIAIVGAGIVLIMKLWTGRKSNASEVRAFAKAAKRSKKKYQPIGKKGSSYGRNKPLRKRSATHLTVIEGKKGKKKDRAIF